MKNKYKPSAEAEQKGILQDPFISETLFFTNNFYKFNIICVVIDYFLTTKNQFTSTISLNS